MTVFSKSYAEASFFEKTVRDTMHRYQQQYKQMQNKLALKGFLSDDELKLLYENDRPDEISFEEFASDSIIMWRYLRKWRKFIKLKSKFSSAEELAEHLDKVDIKLIASFNVEAAYKKAPRFAKQIMKYALPDDSKTIQDEGIQTETKFNINKSTTMEEILERKKRPQPQLHAMIAQAIEKELVGEKNLFVSDRDLKYSWDEMVRDRNFKKKSQQQQEQQQQQSEEQKEEEKLVDAMIDCYANLFVVDKTTKKETNDDPETWKFMQRIILDARIANAIIKNEAKMEIFTLEALLQRVGNLFQKTSKTTQIFATQCDLRHWFHQIALPRRHRQFFRMNFNSKQDPGGNKMYYPRTWPMGFHMSPAVAQACTWSILLNGVEKNKQRLEALDIHWDSSKDFGDYIQWLPLKDGGAVFVCIDNIFIITSKQSVYNEWQKQITTGTKLFNATLKPVSSESTDGAEELFETVIFTHKGRDTQSITFCGVEFSRGRGRRTKSTIDKVESLLNNNNNNDNNNNSNNNNNNNSNNNKWKGTYRELAAIMGQCLWTFRVRGQKLIYLDEFLELYKFVTPKPHETWDSEVPLTIIMTEFPQFHRVLEEHYNLCYEPDKSSRIWSPFENVRKQNSVCFLATDAALEIGANNKIGAMWSIQQEGTTSKIKTTTTTTTTTITTKTITLNNNEQITITTKEIEDVANNNKKELVSSFNALHSQKQIALAELEAVVVALELIKLDRGELPDIIMLGIDSMAAKGMIGRGFSKIGEARRYLKRLDKLLDGRKMFLQYVKSALNPADAPSRELQVNDTIQTLSPENELLWTNLVSKLDEAMPMAKTLWDYEGKTTVQQKFVQQTNNNNQQQTITNNNNNNNNQQTSPSNTNNHNNNGERESGQRRQRDQYQNSK